MYKIIFIFFMVLISGCGGMRGYVIVDDKGIKGDYVEKKILSSNNFVPLSKPNIYVNLSRPATIKIKKNKEGDIEAEIDARNKNNADKIIDTLMPLAALKQI